MAQTKKNLKEQFKILEEYCKQRGYQIKIQSGLQSHLLPDKKLITIDSGHSLEIRIYILLHEIGHIIVLKQKNYSKKYESKINDFSKSSLTYKLTIFEEELDAWEKGFKLADKLNLKIDKRKMEITKTKCLSSYIDWLKK